MNPMFEAYQTHKMPPDETLKEDVKKFLQENRESLFTTIRRKQQEGQEDLKVQLQLTGFVYSYVTKKCVVFVLGKDC